MYEKAHTILQFLSKCDISTPFYFLNAIYPFYLFIDTYMADISTLIVKVANFNNAINLSNKSKATQLFSYSIVTSHLALHDVVTIAVLSGLIPYLATC